MVEHERGERKVGRPRLPQRRDPLVDHAVREQSSDDAVLALHEVEVRVPGPADRRVMPDDEVVEHEVVENDDAGLATQRVDDPRVRVRIVPDVVERDVRAAGRPLRPAAHHVDVDPLSQRRQEQRAVVGDPGLLRRHRAEVGELHDSSLPIARSHVTSRAIAFPARPSDAASSRWSRSQPSARAISAASGATTSPVASVRDDLERPAGVGRRQHGLLREEGLERHHPVVLVDRRVVDGEAARVQVRELALGDAAREASAPVEAALAAQPLQPLAVRPLARDHELEAGLARRRLDEEVDPLRAIEPVHGEDEVPVALAAVVELLRRVRQHLGGQPRRGREPSGDVLRDREETRRLTEGDPIEIVNLPPQRPILGRVAELAERRSVELVRLAELVHEPDALVRMADEIRRELRRDHHVDPAAVGLVEVEHPPEERLREHARAGIPLERNGDDVRLVAARAQLVDERVREDLGAAARERHLRPADGDPHPGPRTRRATMLAP